MKLSQKVFWIFFSITFVTLILAMSQFLTYYAQQRHRQVLDHISLLQTQVRELDVLHLALFQQGKWFDRAKFERLRKESTATCAIIQQEMAHTSQYLQEKLGGLSFHLENFGQALHELAEVRGATERLEAAIHNSLRTLHAHGAASAEHSAEHQQGLQHSHDQANETLVLDLNLQFQVSSYVHHRQYQRLPEIKKSIAVLNSVTADPILTAQLDHLVQMLEKYYQRNLELDDRKQFVESSALNFSNMSREILSALNEENAAQQRLVSQLSLAISFVGVLAAGFYWYRIRVYIRRFLFNQKQVMQALQTDAEFFEMEPQSEDELGELTGTMQDLAVELRTKKADLLESEKKYRSLVESLNEWIWETNVNHRFSYCSEAEQSITGYSQASMLGRKYLELSKGCEEESVFAEVEGHFRERTAFVNVERRITCADGSIKYLMSSGSPLYDKDENFIGFRGVDRDITALVAAREARDQMEERLQHSQKMESIGRLAGGVAHDFNNILSAIIGYAELITHRLEQEHSCFRYVQEIRNSGERAAGLTKQLLAFSRKQTRTPQTLDLGAEALALSDMLRRLVGEQIDLQIEVGDNLWPVLMDKSQLEQVIVNLAVNAKDAMPEGGQLKINLVNCPVDCECRPGFLPEMQQKDTVCLTISDTGCGIPEELLENIFEPFFTTKEKDKGTGLGLAMVYGIITQNNGDLQVDSEVGKGTSFTILLPRSEQGSEQVKEKTQKKDLRKGNETILFAEDENALRQMHCEFLESLGYRVIPAEDGVDALEKYAAAERVDMLVTDVVMPHIGGVELAKRLLEKDPELKVLYTSGYTDRSLFEDGVLKEGTNFVYKPATPMDVVKMMARQLD
ncbi:PAS domain S-box-containing protein [Malonomonas rubra DSM 5091]|uniref:histidine kinase n=1 Tax=Malonomonas rubra DSM 5091 TaxID=1122189 RepID=A0A1M6FC91_MALRU|nr:ATP-binding protein [Malonomonas rubra]SHI95271.1 PAS domain S-box-containing protein [Malonomonas rubra DSM 5091]